MQPFKCVSCRGTNEFRIIESGFALVCTQCGFVNRLVVYQPCQHCCPEGYVDCPYPRCKIGKETSEGCSV